MTPLADILAAHPRFASPALIKIDTDGQDAGILADAGDVLAAGHPDAVLRVRPGHDPRWRPGGDALDIFPGLAAHGYRRALFFTNLGELVVGLDAGELEARWRH